MNDFYTGLKSLHYRLWEAAAAEKAKEDMAGEDFWSLYAAVDDPNVPEEALYDALGE